MSQTFPKNGTVNDPGSPEPSSEQLLAYLETEIALARSRRRPAGSSRGIRLAAVLLIFAAVIGALFLLMTPMLDNLRSKPASESAEAAAETSSKNF